MSASLVGSEMCIRDSPRRKCLRRAHRPDSSPPPDSARKATPNLVDGSLPVSYTHLTLPTICSV
eukprot:11472290-Alexandrium_andersonii.AAC.1